MCQIIAIDLCLFVNTYSCLDSVMACLIVGTKIKGGKEKKKVLFYMNFFVE